MWILLDSVMVKRSRRDDLQSTKLSLMTASNISRNKDLNTLIGTAVVSMLIPLSMVLATTALSSNSAEARTVCSQLPGGGYYCRPAHGS